MPTMKEIAEALREASNIFEICAQTSGSDVWVRNHKRFDSIASNVEQMVTIPPQHQGEKFSAYLDRITPDRPEWISDRDHAWIMLRSELEPEKWTTAEAANYRGFFNHGWDAGASATDEVIRALVEALEEIQSWADLPPDCDAEEWEKDNERAEKAIAQARKHLGE